jgi:hypothetical protein
VRKENQMRHLSVDPKSVVIGLLAGGFLVSVVSKPPSAGAQEPGGTPGEYQISAVSAGNFFVLHNPSGEVTQYVSVHGGGWDSRKVVDLKK